MIKPTLEICLEYLNRHWSIIPVLSRDKRPAIRWAEYQHRHASREEVEAWFERWPASNIGIVTGAISGLVVLDIDAEHGGNKSLTDLTKKYGPIPETIEVITGGGGRHLYFKHPGGLVKNQVGLVKGVDLRGDGGCVVAPPSMHASGVLYAWRAHHAPDQIELAVMPKWLLNEVSSEKQARGHTLDYWRKLIRNGVVQGERNTQVASISGHLLWHGVDPEVVQELMLCWNRVRCQPPLSDKEIVVTVDSITRLHDRNLLEV